MRLRIRAMEARRKTVAEMRIRRLLQNQNSLLTPQTMVYVDQVYVYRPPSSKAAGRWHGPATVLLTDDDSQGLGGGVLYQY